MSEADETAPKDKAITLPPVDMQQLLSEMQQLRTCSSSHSSPPRHNTPWRTRHFTTLHVTSMQSRPSHHIPAFPFFTARPSQLLSA